MSKLKKQLLAIKKSSSKLVQWNTFIPRSVLPIEKESKAGLVIDKKGAPQLFVFDTFALLDLLSEIDERLVDRLSDKDYYSKKINPAGWLIDQIEASLPLKKEYVESLKQAIREAEENGWIPLEDLEKELNLI
jgi:hypothetical protein